MEFPDAASPASPQASAPLRAGRTNVAAVEGCYQLVLWLIPVLDALPRRQKFQLGDRLQTTALDAVVRGVGRSAVVGIDAGATAIAAAVAVEGRCRCRGSRRPRSGCRRRNNGQGGWS